MISFFGLRPTVLGLSIWTALFPLFLIVLYCSFYENNCVQRYRDFSVWATAKIDQSRPMIDTAFGKLANSNSLCNGNSVFLFNTSYYFILMQTQPRSRVKPEGSATRGWSLSASRRAGIFSRRCYTEKPHRCYTEFSA